MNKIKQAFNEWWFSQYTKENATYEDVFIAGAEWMKKTMIDKACKFLEDKIDYCEIDCGDEDKIINDFKKYMEGGEE